MSNCEVHESGTDASYHRLTLNFQFDTGSNCIESNKLSMIAYDLSKVC